MKKEEEIHFQGTKIITQHNKSFKLPNIYTYIKSMNIYPYEYYKYYKYSVKINSNHLKI